MDSPIRVLHVVVNMNRGGAETFIMNLYRNIDRSRVQFDFLTCKPGVFDQEIKDMGGIIHRIPYLSEVGPSKYQKQLKDFFLKHPEYKILHSHLDKVSGMVCKVATKCGIPIRIAHSHNTESEGNRVYKLYKWYLGTHIRKTATHFVACSKKAGEWLFGKSDLQTTIIKNGVESEVFTFSEDRRHFVRQNLNLHEEALVIGHIGRFHLQKNHAFLIEVFAETLKFYPNAILVLVGDGPLRNSMERLAVRRRVRDRILFLGIRDDIPNLLQAFDLMLFPSHHEGLPVTIIEAQAAGLPCVLSEHITQEIDLGVQLIRYARLSDKEEWLSKIRFYAKREFSRDIPAEALAVKGFDIRLTAKWMTNFYINLLYPYERRDDVG